MVGHDRLSAWKVKSPISTCKLARRPPPCPPSMTSKQARRLHKTEVALLVQLVQHPDIQAKLLLPRTEFPVKQAAALLTERFRERVTTPAPGESDKEFKIRLRNAHKSRKPFIQRIVAETDAAFEARQAAFPDVRILGRNLAMGC